MPVVFETRAFETNAAVNAVRAGSQLEPIAAILARIFTHPAPCCGCTRPVPTYRDQETGLHYCLDCLEDAVTASQIEMQEERQDSARLAACFGQLAI